MSAIAAARRRLELARNPRVFSSRRINWDDRNALRDENRTRIFIRNPIYTYSLRQGNRGRFPRAYLSPPESSRSGTDSGWRPSTGGYDRYGRRIPDEMYDGGF